MPGTFKTEAVVLRSMRYGEADRILQLYSRARGRVGAIAKGSRRARSRFGGRLEPFFRLDLVLHEGRGELATVTAASTIDGHSRLRADGHALDGAARACDGVLRLLDSGEANPAAYNLLIRYLTLMDSRAGSLLEGTERRALALSFRLKLALAAGFVPELAACARCGQQGRIAGFSGQAGGIVCDVCEGDAMVLSRAAHSFMVGALGLPLAEAPVAEEAALAQAERAIQSTLEHHAHVRLRAACA